MTLTPAHIARLEIATQGSDDLDEMICEVLSLSRDYDADGNYGPYKILPSYRRFTRSVDAALKLLPDGIIIDHLGDNVVSFPNDMTINGAAARVGNGFHVVVGTGATRPLAICIAAMKARMTP